MGYTKNSKFELNVTVYWGGAELGSYTKPLKKARSVTAGKSYGSEISSSVWPRWDQLEIIRKTRSGLILNPNIPWNGVIANERGSYNLNALKPSRKIFEIGPGTSASLRLDDMSIVIRVGPPLNKQMSRVKTASGYIASPLSLLADRRAEWIALGVAMVASGVITLGARSTLMSRDDDRYKTIAEVPDVTLQPFISQKYLADGPNVIQFSLDRFNYLQNVWNFYTEFAQTLGFGQGDPNHTMLFPTTISEYQNLFAEQRKHITTAEAQQESALSAARPGQSILTMPTARGETLDGKILRILDKISIYSSSAQDNARRRVAVADEFDKDLGLTKEEDTEKPTNQAFEKIAQGYLGIESDDKMQRSLAETSAAKAALAQMGLFGKQRLIFGPVECCETAAGAPVSQAGLTWLGDEDTQLDKSIKIAALKASVWGAPQRDEPTIIEPMAGRLEPALVEKTVNAGRYQLRLCYELALRRNQAAKGTMEWRWLINTTGQITDLDLLQSSIKDDELVKCVHDKIANWKFPKPKGGSVEVRYPFEFYRDKG
jgi:hypothetical protein